MVTGSPWADSHPQAQPMLPVLQMQPGWNTPTGTQHPRAALSSQVDGGPAASKGARCQAQPILCHAEQWVRSLCCLYILQARACPPSGTARLCPQVLPPSQGLVEALSSLCLN